MRFPLGKTIGDSTPFSISLKIIGSSVKYIKNLLRSVRFIKTASKHSSRVVRPIYPPLLTITKASAIPSTKSRKFCSIICSNSSSSPGNLTKSLLISIGSSYIGIRISRPALCNFSLTRFTSCQLGLW